MLVIQSSCSCKNKLSRGCKKGKGEMMSAENIDGRFDKIDTQLAEIKKLLFQNHVVSISNSITDLAEMVANGDTAALRRYNKSKAAQVRH
jgi:hypothetical protein